MLYFKLPMKITKVFGMPLLSMGYLNPIYQGQWSYLYLQIQWDEIIPVANYLRVTYLGPFLFQFESSQENVPILVTSKRGCLITTIVCKYVGRTRGTKWGGVRRNKKNLCVSLLDQVIQSLGCCHAPLFWELLLLCTYESYWNVAGKVWLPGIPSHLASPAVIG